MRNQESVSPGEGTTHYDRSLRLWHDWNSGNSVSTTIALGVAELTDTDVTELESLSNVLNPDALDELFTDRGGDWQLTFTYAGQRVSVDSSGEVVIRTV